MLIIGVIVTFGAIPFTLLDPGLDVITVSIIFFPIEAFSRPCLLIFCHGAHLVEPLVTFFLFSLLRNLNLA
jgi:hypothetical protein